MEDVLGLPHTNEEALSPMHSGADLPAVWWPDHIWAEKKCEP